MSPNTEHNVVWGLEIGGSALRLIRVTRTGSGYRADRYQAVALDDRWGEASDVASAAAQLNGAGVDGPIVACLSDELILHRTLSLPVTAGDGLDKMVAAQMEVLIPTQADRFVTGYHGCGPSGDGVQTVWAAAARTDAVDQAAGVCKKLGEPTGRIVPALSALATFWREMGDGDEPVVLIDVAARCTSIAVISDRAVVQCGVVDEGVDRWIERVGAEAGTPPAEAQAFLENGSSPDALAEALADWAWQVREALEHCLAELPRDRRPARCVLFGRGGSVASVAETVSRSLGIPATAAVAAKSLELADGVSLSEAAGAIGAALCAMVADAPAVDLVAPEPVEKAGRSRPWHWVALIGWLVVAAALMYWQDHSHAERLGDALGQLRTKTARAGGLQRQRAIGNHLEMMGPTPMDILDRLSDVMPDKTVLSSFTHSRTRTGTSVRFAGEAPNAKVIPKLLEDLRPLGVPTWKGNPVKKKFQFEIQLELAGSLKPRVSKPSSPTATQPAATQATSHPSTQPGGAASSGVAPHPDSQGEGGGS